ncbi:unnamed protein product, partial [Angiostrongylus costaricensis]|uniref:Neurotoxin n=1 Tax=Angiostrongylus costaricensis TaxID=334426 RepID=A0A0R3PED4_ANGCS
FFVFSIVLTVFVSSIKNSFNVPPTGICWAEKDGDCMRCDCRRPLKCYKGTCR